MMRRGLLFVSAFACAIAISSPAHAEGEGEGERPAAAEQHGEAHEAAPAHDEHEAEAGHHEGAGGNGEPHATGEHHGEHAEAEEGIENWWQWDSGPNATDPANRHLPRPFGWALVNFAIFLFLMSKILWKPLKAGWEQRHVEVKGELDEAAKLRKAAEAQLTEFTQKVANADAEVTALLTQLRKDAEGERARIVAAAEAEAKRLRADAERQIAVEIERARAELRRETVDAALKAAEQILRDRINPEDQQKLAQAYLGELETAKRVGTSGGAA